MPAKVLEHITAAIHRVKGADGKPAYTWKVGCLNSKNFGVAQNRERVYVVGRLRACSRLSEREVRLPIRRAPPPKPRGFLESHVICGPSERPTQRTALGNLCRAEAEADRLMKGRCDDDLVIDLGGSLKRRVSCMTGMCPTITRSRGGTASYWVSSLGRRLSPIELLRLQGFEPHQMRLHRLSPQAIGRMAGNAMTLPVLATVLKWALYGTDLVSEH